MNILIIRLSSMGDVILVSPLLSHLKKHLPEANLFFLTYTLYSPFFKDDPHLTSTFELSKTDKDLKIPEINSHKWDLIIDLQNNRKSRIIRKKYFSGVKCRIFNKLHIKRFLLLFFRLNFYRKGEDVVRRYIQASGTAQENMGSSRNPVKLYFENAKECKTILFRNDEKERHSVIALIPFSAWKNKQWPMSCFISVGKYFSGKNWKVAILGGPEDRSDGEKIEKEIGKNCISLAGKINLYEAGGVLKMCRLALGNDTGLSHLARSCEVKTGMVFGATTYHFGFFPYGKPDFKIFQSKEFCRPCHAHGGNVCLRISRPCLNNINVQQVIDGLEELDERETEIGS